MKLYISEENIREGVFFMPLEPWKKRVHVRAIMVVLWKFGVQAMEKRSTRHGKYRYGLWKKEVHAMEKRGTRWSRKKCLNAL